jgi:Tol biopolymer transport system component
MTTFERPDPPLRFEHELRAFLEGESRLGHPDYLSDVLLESAGMRQRPAWTFPERWLPMEVVTTRVAPPPRVPWRMVVLALLLIALSAAALVYVGSQRRPPAPFGPAENGLVAYSADGDIFTLDLATGARRAIVAGAAVDRDPRFSRDGTRLVFQRATPNGTQLVGTDADGRNERVLTPEPFLGMDSDAMWWSADGRSIAVNAVPLNRGEGSSSLFIVDAAGGGARELLLPYTGIESYWRPPDGRQLLFVGPSSPGNGLFLVSPDSTGLELISQTVDGSVPRPLGWTPDGRRLLYQPFEDDSTSRTRVLDLEAGTAIELPVSFGHISHDGTRVVGFLDGGQLCVVSIDGGPCDLVGDPTRAPDGTDTMSYFWSPDDRHIVVVSGRQETFLVDVETGRQSLAPWQGDYGVSWQRR